jgi:GDP-D-mannose 3',5'-epimerase
MSKQKTALVAGAGGFIGSHMVKRLKAEGYWVRGVDLKFPEFSDSPADEFEICDLRDSLKVSRIMFGPTQHSLKDENAFDEVYQFAADMGGAGYVFTGENDATIMHNSALINLNVADQALAMGVKKLFYSSSACMYPKEIQSEYNELLFALKERYAYPANPDSEYGWEKLFSERFYLACARNNGLNVRIARFHNIYGPEGTYTGGKEKAPAAVCRKVANAAKYALDECPEFIDIWGDGKQTRSFLYIDDCIDAVRLLMQSDFKEPINIGSEEMISINDLAKMVIEISGKSIAIKNIDGPVGVRGRNSDNTLIREKLGWEPKYKLYDGMVKTYAWIKEQTGSDLQRHP